MTNPTLDAIDLGDCQTESQSKESNLFNFPIPYRDSTDSVLADLMGTSRNITLSMKFIGTVSELRTFVGQIEGIQDGQQSGSSYTGTLIVTSKTVLIQTFNWDYEKANLNTLNYTLTLVEGKPI